MQIQPITQQSIKTNNNLSNTRSFPLFKRERDSVSFKSKFNKSKFLKEKFLNKIFNKKLCECNFEKLEGAQIGLKSFEGLSIKQIAFALTDLHAIIMVSGCTNHCLHCYANAQPYIKRYPYEDLKQICDDIKELQNRTGAKPCYHHGHGYIDIGFDTDGLDCHIFDKNGQKYDSIDIAKMIKKSTGYPCVFDTNGWDTKEKQIVAENYVKKLMQDKNYKNFLQINVSINPFNPKYIRALNSGYDTDELYRPLEKIYSENEFNPTPPELEKAQKLYTSYIKRTVNTLLTFKPLLNINKLGVITRAISDDVETMQGFRLQEFNKTLSHIYAELNLRKAFGFLSEKELQKYFALLQKIDYTLFSSGRMEKFYKAKNNGSLKGIEKIDIDRIEADKRFEKIKTCKKLSPIKMRYLKMITADGKVFSYDNYKVIPTDIQLKTSTENINKPFQIKIEDFTITEDMIDLI